MHRLILSVSLPLCLVACNHEPAQQQAELYVFGTLVSLTAAGTTEATANRAFADIGRQFQQMHRDWHAWEPGELTRLNAALAAGETWPVSPGIYDLVQKSQEMESASGGLFNAGLGRLVRLWGFHTSTYPVIGPPPGTEEIRVIMDARPSSLDIETGPHHLSCTNPVVQLDFGGIAKGAAADTAVEIMRSYGIPAGIVNAGGDLRAYGDPAHEPWNIAVRAPGGGIIGGLEVATDEAVFTSGNYHRFRQDDSQRYAHILDPRTGWPVKGVSSATVIASEGWRADAAATALLVAGPQEFARVAADMQISAALLIDEDNVLHMTSAMASRLSLIEAQAWQTVEYHTRDSR